MIATILPSSPTFHAVAYNESKVAQGKAKLLELKNFGPIDTFGYSSTDELTQYLMEYTSRNDRIKQPQFHLAISCKGNEYTEEQLVEFAHRYLEEMGYGDPGQPLLIYGHHDTDNTHIHIVTSRIDPSGKKINDSNERRKSQKVLEKLLKTDMKEAAEKDIKTAMQFDFRNVNQFKAVMEAMNYECYEYEGMICVKKGGMVQSKIDKDTVAKQADTNKLSYKRDVASNAKWKAIFKKYRDTNTTRSGLERDLKKMFGVSLVFFGKKDSPYGYVAVDFHNKKVIEGGNILGVKDLLDFRTAEEHMNEIEEFISKAFEQHARITTKELNKKLRRFGAYVRKDSIVFGNLKKAMAESHRAILERNNKIDWRNGFKPQTAKERDLLCKLTGYEYPELISISKSSNGQYYCKDYKELYDIFTIADIAERTKAYETSGFKMIVEDGEVYAYRPETQTLTNMARTGIAREQYASLLPTRPITASNNNKADKNDRPNKASRLNQPSQSRDGSRYANREWEVGKKEKDRDDLDQNGSVSY